MSLRHEVVGRREERKTFRRVVLAWDHPGVNRALTESLVFLVKKKEKLGLVGVELFRNVDGPAKISAKVIEAEFLLLDGVECAGIERVVANEFVGAAVERVGAGLEGDVDNGTGILPVFGAVVGGEHLELGDGVWVDVDKVVTAAIVLVVDAVHVPGEGVGAATVGGLAAGVSAKAAGKAKADRVVSGKAGDERKKLDEVAAIELKLGSLSACDKAVDFAAGGFDVGGIGTDGDAFVHRSDFGAGCRLRPWR